jgi:hypothetical protein
MDDRELVRAYRDQVEALLDIAQGLLSDVERDAVRLLVRLRHDGDVELHHALAPRVREIADDLVGQLEAAERQLAHDDVLRLERLIQDWLDVGL